MEQGVAKSSRERERRLDEERDEIGEFVSLFIHTTYIRVSARRKKHIDLENCCCVLEQFKTRKEVRSDFFFSFCFQAHN
jgi:hypothetical protein